MTVRGISGHAAMGLPAQEVWGLNPDGWADLRREVVLGLLRLLRLSLSPGLLTWSEIWCDVENSKSFRSSRDRHIFPGHRLKDASALHNYLASIFTAPSVTTWSDMSGNTRKNQVTRLVTLRHRSIMSGALVPPHPRAQFRAEIWFLTAARLASANPCVARDCLRMPPGGNFQF
jgi:hypothetical protein